MADRFFDVLWNPHFGMASGARFCDLGSVGVPFGDNFGHFWGTVLGSIFGGFPGLSKSQGRAGVEGDLGGIWGPVTGLHQQDKQIYRWKSADL